tara:strand:+ start:318 stop:1010 length:693 start_codon:yes stop_codon:yes gene_type:complete
METSENLTRQLTLDELIYLQEDSPANPTAPQGNEKERKTNAICGPRCLELFESVHRVGSWERMFAGLLIGTGDWFSKRCALTWKLVGTPYNRLFFQLLPSTLPTEETECGLLLTPTSVMTDEPPERMRERAEKNGYRNGTQFGSLKSQILYGNMLPTPTASCWNTGTEKERPENEPTRRSELNHLIAQEAGKPSQLNPHFVEEMMGFPKNWTVLPFQSGGENQSKHTETP